MLIDVGGEEESGSRLAVEGNDVVVADLVPARDGNPRSRRDSTALTVVEIDLDARHDGLPIYRVVHRRIWTGVRHTILHDQLADLARNAWKASWVVVDATGIGAGLASFLKSNLGRRHGKHPAIPVVPFVFTAASKSRLGWDFLGLIDSGRFKDYTLAHDCHPEPAKDPRAKHVQSSDAITAEYYAQLQATTYEVLNGPGNTLRWSVPAREGHDDLVISASLCAVLDGLDHRPRIARGVS
jgi:hypothetical protein